MYKGVNRVKGKLVSVIIPIYNVEQYLKRCVDSVINQTYKNIEIILVDDGSPDNCNKICDEYAKADKRIKVIHKTNGGLSSARNEGLNIAEGEYICFIDSDDWVSESFVEFLINNIIKENADIITCETLDVKNERDIEENKKGEYLEIKTYDKDYVIENMYSEKLQLKPAVQNKMYKSYIFDNLRFKEGMIHEDEEILIKILLKSNKITITNKKLYYYFLSTDSIMRRKFNINRLNILDALEERIDILTNTKYKNALNQTINRYYEQLNEMYFLLKTSDIKEKEHFLNQVKQKIKRTKKRLTNYTIKKKVKMFIKRNMPTIVKIIKTNKNRS